MCSTPEGLLPTALALAQPLPQGVRLGSTKNLNRLLLLAFAGAVIKEDKLLRRLVAEPEIVKGRETRRQVESIRSSHKVFCGVLVASYLLR